MSFYNYAKNIYVILIANRYENKGTHLCLLWFVLADSQQQQNMNLNKLQLAETHLIARVNEKIDILTILIDLHTKFCVMLLSITIQMIFT